MYFVQPAGLISYFSHYPEAKPLTGLDIRLLLVPPFRLPMRKTNVYASRVKHVMIYSHRMNGDD